MKEAILEARQMGTKGLIRNLVRLGLIRKEDIKVTAEVIDLSKEGKNENTKDIR